jgi:hypothetical protein
MKDFFSRILVTGLMTFFVCIGTVGCGNQPVTSVYTPVQMVSAIATSQSDLPELKEIDSTDADFMEYVENHYQINAKKVSEGAVLYPFGVTASEFAVFVCTSQKDAQEVQSALVTYASDRADSFVGYAPGEAAIAENAEVVTRGCYVALLMCPNPNMAVSTFHACFEDADDTVNSSANRDSHLGTESDVEKDSRLDTDINTGEDSQSKVDADNQSKVEGDTDTEVYHGDRVLEALKAENSEELSGKDLAVYHVVSEALQTLITSDMTVYDKELAVHDFIVRSTVYDPEAHSAAPDASPDPDNDNPYGTLVKGYAICYGYASSFQLFMDVLNIQCVSISGWARGDEEHAWNMVCLEGDWYCVDVGWDDPLGIKGDEVQHTFFNVTSAYMRRTDHQWDEANTPEATGTKYAYKSVLNQLFQALYSFSN